MDRVTIYVLELEQQKYYVGKTRSSLPLERVLDHFRGEGSAWTRRYKPVEVFAIYPNKSSFDEDKFTKEYMSIFGIENVRGGTYCRIDLDQDTIRFLQREIRGAKDQCFRCGRNNHFIHDCYATKRVDGTPIIEATHPSSSSSSSSSPSPSSSSSSSPSDESEDESDESEEERDYGRDTCFHCGRFGHWANRCRARRDVYGKPLWESKRQRTSY